MTRPLRIEFPGAVYHVTSRGDRREAIYADEADRADFLDVLALSLARHRASVLAYCLMTNHYHLVVRTQEANLSLLMQHLNGVYTQRFNRRYGLTGHLFQGRFKAILVDTDSYLTSLCQYVELNPVRAHMVAGAADWAWSSYRAHAGLAEGPAWLDLGGIASFMLGRDATTAQDLAEAAKRYAEVIEQQPPKELWADGLRQQMYLGDEDFVQRMQSRADVRRLRDQDLAKEQRVPWPMRSLAQWLQLQPSREAALRAAHVESGISMTALAKELGLSVARVSQLIKKAEANAQRGR